MKPKKQPAPAITAARQPTWRCAAIPTLSGCRPWRRLPITFRFPPLPRKRGRQRKHIKKQPALGFSMCRLLFQIRRMSGVQAAFDVLCYAAYAANFWPGGNLLPLLWERAGGRAFRDDCPFRGERHPRVDMAAIRHALPLNLLPPFGFTFSHNVMGNGE